MIFIIINTIMTWGISAQDSIKVTSLYSEGIDSLHCELIDLKKCSFYLISNLDTFQLENDGTNCIALPSIIDKRYKKINLLVALGQNTYLFDVQREKKFRNSLPEINILSCRKFKLEHSFEKGISVTSTTIGPILKKKNKQ